MFVSVVTVTELETYRSKIYVHSKFIIQFDGIIVAETYIESMLVNKQAVTMTEVRRLYGSETRHCEEVSNGNHIIIRGYFPILNSRDVGGIDVFTVLE